MNEMDFSGRLLSFSAVAALGYLALLTRLLQGSWLAPGAAWAAYWVFAAGLPLLLAPGYPVSPTALWVIVAFAAVIGFGAVIGQHAAGRRTISPRKARPPASIGFMRCLCIGGGVAGIAATAITLSAYGAGWSVWTNPESLSAVSRQISGDRYQQQMVEPLAVRLSLAVNYCGALVGGCAMAWQQKRKRSFLLFAPVFSALLYAVLTTAKAGVLFAAALWMCAYVGERLKRGSEPIRLRPRTVVAAFIALGLLVALFWFAMLLRYGFEHGEDRDFMIERLRNYSMAHISVFSGWWESAPMAEPSWGRSLFFGPLDMLGVSPRVQGVYTVLDNYRFWVDSNIFTIHRGLIEDFGFAGGLLGAFGSAAVAGYCFSSIRRGGGRPLASVVVAGYYTVLLWSPIVNPFGYTSICLAFFVYAIVQLRACLIARAQETRNCSLCS